MYEYDYYLFIYRFLMFPLLSVPKVNLFSSSTFLCRFIPSSQYPALSFLLKLPTSTNFEVFRFFVFQVGTIPQFYHLVLLWLLRLPLPLLPFCVHWHIFFGQWLSSILRRSYLLWIRSKIYCYSRDLLLMVTFEVFWNLDIPRNKEFPLFLSLKYVCIWYLCISLCVCKSGFQCPLNLPVSKYYIIPPSNCPHLTIPGRPTIIP